MLSLAGWEQEVKTIDEQVDLINKDLTRASPNQTFSTFGENTIAIIKRIIAIFESISRQSDQRNEKTKTTDSR